MSGWFKDKTGVKQGCVMLGFLFILTIDWVMHQTTTGAGTGIRWKMTRLLEDLDFADDICTSVNNNCPNAEEDNKAIRNSKQNRPEDKTKRKPKSSG